MIDIVTVVFQEELPTLKLQAQSIDLYCQNIGIKNIYVVVNDHNHVVDYIDPLWWGSLSHTVKILPRSVFSTEFVDNGWLSQQVLKILASTVSYNTWSMILDAKTVITRPILLDYLFDKQHRLTVSYHPIADVFLPSRNIVNQLFDIELTHVAGPSGIPFFFHNNTVRSMVADVSRLVNQDFPLWFQQQGMLTEFILYTGYVYYRDHTLDQVYSIDSSFEVCNICHSEVSRADYKLDQMNNPEILTVSIHRNAWKQLTDQQKYRYQNFLITRGISRAQELT
jgi:hypothetical protein